MVSSKVAVVEVVIFSPRCLVVEWEEECIKKDHRKENQYSTLLKLLLRKYIKEKPQKLP